MKISPNFGMLRFGMMVERRVRLSESMQITPDCLPRVLVE